MLKQPSPTVSTYFQQPSPFPFVGFLTDKIVLDPYGGGQRATKSRHSILPRTFALVSLIREDDAPPVQLALEIVF
jgi:hypothetical protein